MKTFHHPIAFYPHLARELEEIPAAIFFQQLLYWSTRCGRDDGWIYKSKDDMEEETTLTREQQDRIRKKLIDKGWIEEKVMKNPAGTPTMHYRCLVTISVAVEPTGVKPTGREGGLVENPHVLDRSETHKSLYSTETTSETTKESSKTSKKLSPKEISASMSFSKELNVNEFHVEWYKWICCRMVKKTPSKGWVVFFQSQLDNLATFGIQEALRCVKQSVLNDYTGLFPQKPSEKTTGYRNGSQMSDIEQVSAAKHVGDTLGFTGLGKARVSK